MCEWDEEKSEKNLSERGLDFGDVFRCVTFEDTRSDYGEPRFITFGVLVGRMVVIAQTRRGVGTRIISMRKANDHEEKIY